MKHFQMASIPPLGPIEIILAIGLVTLIVSSSLASSSVKKAKKLFLISLCLIIGPILWALLAVTICR